MKPWCGAGASESLFNEPLEDCPFVGVRLWEAVETIMLSVTIGLYVVRQVARQRAVLARAFPARAVWPQPVPAIADWREYQVQGGGIVVIPGPPPYVVPYEPAHDQD